MKNKAVKQMMLSMGNHGLALVLMQREISSRCNSLKNKGSYLPNIDMPIALELASIKYRSLIEVTNIKGVSEYEQGKYHIAFDINYL